MRWMFAVLRCQFPAEFFVFASDDQGLKRSRDFIQLGEDAGNRTHSETAAQDKNDWQIIPQSMRLANVQSIDLCGEFRRDRNAGSDDIFRVRTPRNQPRPGFLSRDAIQIDAAIHPKGVSFEIGNDGDNEWTFAAFAGSRAVAPFLSVALGMRFAESFERQVMRADNDVGVELFQIAIETGARGTRKSTLH